jgi:hypothetical protein
MTLHVACSRIEGKCIKHDVAPPYQGESIESSFNKIIVLIEKLEEKIDELENLNSSFEQYFEEHMYVIRKHYFLDKIILDKFLGRDKIDTHNKKMITHEITNKLFDDELIKFDIIEKESTIEYIGELKVFK